MSCSAGGAQSTRVCYLEKVSVLNMKRGEMCHKRLTWLVETTRGCVVA